MQCHHSTSEKLMPRTSLIRRTSQPHKNNDSRVIRLCFDPLTSWTCTRGLLTRSDGDPMNVIAESSEFSDNCVCVPKIPTVFADMLRMQRGSSLLCCRGNAHVDVIQLVFSTVSRSAFGLGTITSTRPVVVNINEKLSTVPPHRCRGLAI